MKVAYLSGQRLATASVKPMLEDLFGRAQTSAIPCETLGQIDLNEIDLLFLPGTVGEISPYSEILTPAAIDNLTRAIFDRGLIIWSDCAATYHMCRAVEYHASTGELRHRQGLGLIDASAKGPIKGQAVAPSLQDRFADVVIQRVRYTGDNNLEHYADICYGNGPGLHLDAAELSNPDVEVLAWYHGTEQDTAAAVAKKLGRGLVMSLGVLVQISPDHLAGKFTHPALERHREALFNHLSGANHTRKHFLDRVLARINNHYANLRNSGTTAPFLLQTRHA